MTSPSPEDKTPFRFATRMRNENFRWGFFGVAGVATICLGFAAKNAFVGGYTRNYANKVIAEITTSNNYTSVRKKVDFLLRDDQYGFLTSQQADALTKKKGTISLIEEQLTSDKFLTESVRWAIAEPITVDNYKGIIFTAATAPQKNRFNLLVNQADQMKLAEKKKEAETQGPILEVKKKHAADKEKERTAAEAKRRDVDEILDVLTEIRKEATRRIVANPDLQWDSDNDPLRLSVVGQLKGVINEELQKLSGTLSSQDIKYLKNQLYKQIESNL